MASTVLITGAYGYIGSLLRRRFDRAGWKTVALVRTPRNDDPAAVDWALGRSFSPSVLEGAQALIHCAWDFSATTRDAIQAVNVGGSAELLRAAAEARVPRIVFVSSMSAFAGTTQLYGRAKLAVEDVVMSAGGIAIRPGLVYGPDPAGMAGTLRKLTRLPIVPVIGGQAAHQFPVHEDDLADTVLDVVASDRWTPEVFGIAHSTPVTFAQLLQALAPPGRRLRFLPIPWRPVFGLLAASERIGLELPIRSDSVLGLVRPSPSVQRSRTFGDLQDRLRPL